MIKENTAIEKSSKEVTEEENYKIMRRCPRFKFCNAPKCPLDYFINDRVKLTGEDKCALPKSIRKRIGKGTELEYQGMTKREWIGKKIWEAKSDEAKREIIEKGKIRLAKLRQNQS